MGYQPLSLQQNALITLATDSSGLRAVDRDKAKKRVNGR